jgi:polysaccharide export outer membrane protein
MRQTGLRLFAPVTIMLAWAAPPPSARAAEQAAATQDGTTAGGRGGGAASVADLYRIVPGDKLDIKFFYQPELDTQVTVRPDGRISLQLLDDVDAAGLTVTDLREQLTERYSPELRDPEIAVILASSAARVYVDGEVNRPGPVAYLTQMSVLEAVSEAGGLRDTASSGQLLVIRPSWSREDPTVRELSYDKALRGETQVADVLQASDIVYVPRSRIAKVNRWIDQYLRKNIPIPLTLGWYRGL